MSPTVGAASGHWLGTDPLGRDLLANLVFSCQTALLFSLPAALLSALLGALLGGVAGFWGQTLRLAAPEWAVVAGLLWWALELPYASLGLVVTLVAASWALACRLTHRRLPT